LEDADVSRFGFVTGLSVPLIRSTTWMTGLRRRCPDGRRAL